MHADIKPDNILIDLVDDKLVGLKLIDFGSSFIFTDTVQSVTATTPEYLAPEVLQSLDSKSNFQSIQKPWSYDVWSLGVTLLELVSGIPIWMSLKCKTVSYTGKSSISTGLFGVQGRQNSKILQK